MVRNQARSNRKPSGGRYKYKKVRRQHESGREAANTKIGEDKKLTVRTLGGNKKHKALACKDASVVDSKGEHHTLEIQNVVENPANRHFVRRNIVTKGAVIETKKGKARVTNRPGQQGTVEAKLLE